MSSRVIDTPVFFDRALRSRGFATGMLGEHDVLPTAVKQPQGPCLTPGHAENAVWYVVVAGDNFVRGVDQIGTQLPIAASPFVGLVAGSGVAAGAGLAHDNYKAYQNAKNIHDITGQKLAALGGLEMGMFAMGSAADATTKVFAIVQEVGRAIHNPIIFGVAAATALTVITLASTILYGLFYAICAARLGYLGVSWVRGRAWRQELSQANDPMQALYAQLSARINHIDDNPKDTFKLALKAGAQWLEKIEKASDGRLSIPDKEEAFQKLIEAHPEIIGQLIGTPRGEATPNEELMRFGKYIAYQQACAKFEAECSRKLGSAAVKAMKAGNPEELKNALVSRNWKGLAIKIGIAVVGFTAVLAGAMVLLGSPAGVLLILAGILSVALGVFGDGFALVTQMQKGEFTRHDWKYVYPALLLSLTSFVGVVALTIATGGLAPLAVSLVLSSIWLCANAHSAYALWRYNNRKWEAQKVVDLVTYRKFLKTKPSERKILKVQQKLSTKDKRRVARLGTNALKELRAQKAALKRERQGQLGELISKIEPLTLEAAHS